MDVLQIRNILFCVSVIFFLERRVTIIGKRECNNGKILIPVCNPYGIEFVH